MFLFLTSASEPPGTRTLNPLIKSLGLSAELMNVTNRMLIFRALLPLSHWFFRACFESYVILLYLQVNDRIPGQTLQHNPYHGGIGPGFTGLR